jgi:hypothetical protein
MILNKALTGLNIESPLATPNAANFIPPTWPPTKDFPIVIDAQGQTISRYGDHVWNLTPWSNRIISINFGDGIKRKNDPGIDSENADIFRQIVAWWIYGPGRSKSAGHIINRFDTLRPLFILCSKEKISATDLVRYPRVSEKLVEVLPPSTAARALTFLHDIWEQRDDLGLFILDFTELSKLASWLTKHVKNQTPYIPPRIWIYQLNRLRVCLDDFNIHRQQIEDCFQFCLDAYAKNSGSLAQACSESLPPSGRPFQTSAKQLNGSRTRREYHGSFLDTARRFGIDSLLDRWLNITNHSGVNALSTYFNFIGYVGSAYLVNFSLMRVEETFSLRLDCLSTEKDEISGEDIYILQGVTTKTIADNDARWITSPSASAALEAMGAVAKLRTIAAGANPDVPTTDEDIRNPYLVLRAYEPWRIKGEAIHLPIATRPNYQSYASIVDRYPKLFDLDELRITEGDIQAARLITPTLNIDTFEVGQVWRLAWHQLRRTGAVNMNASGVVGDSSIQYQLKHSNRAMTRYYGQGFYNLSLSLNGEVRAEYIRAMYEMIAQEFTLLQSPRFISPHGDKRKEQILRIISEKDHKSLILEAKTGKVGYRETLLGGCANPTPCPYGGIDHVARCGGGDGKPPCQDALLDREKIPNIRKLRDIIVNRLFSTPEGSPLYESLQAQQYAVESTLNVLEAN